MIVIEFFFMKDFHATTIYIYLQQINCNSYRAITISIIIFLIIIRVPDLYIFLSLQLEVVIRGIYTNKLAFNTNKREEIQKMN